MPSPVIRVDQDALKTIGRSFQQSSEACGKTVRELKAAMEVLRGGDWIGQGAKKFYREMEADVLPAMQRLTSSLDRSAQVIGRIGKVMKQAEEEAARIFRTEAVGLMGVIAGALGTALGAAAAAAAATAAGKSDPRADAVKKLIDAGDKQGAIDEAIKRYGIDSSKVNGKPAYNSSTSGEGATSASRNVSIGDAAFSSPGWLASSVGHEALHARQSAEGRWYTDPQGDAINEIECYDWEVKNAPANGLSAAEVSELVRRRTNYYNPLNAANKKRIDGGTYTKP